jgi:hypothetical protein
VNTLLAVCLAAISCSSAVDIPSADDVMRGVEDSEQGLRSFSVTSRITATDMPRREGATERVTRLLVTYTVEASGKSRCKMEELAADGRVVKSAIETYDGQEFRSLSGSAPEPGGAFEKYQFGRISAHAYDRTWVVNPWDFTIRFGLDPVSQVIKAHGIEAYGSAEWEGRPIVRIVAKPVKAGFTSKNLFLIDYERGFAVVKRASLVEQKPGEWFEYHAIEGHDLVEAGPNIWLPRKVSTILYSYTVGTPPRLVSRMTIENENWDVNKTIPESTFRIEFPADVFVTDAIRGTHYRTTKITDQVLIDSVAEARTAESWRRRSGQPGGAPIALLAAVGGLVALSATSLCVVLLKKRRASRSGDGEPR